MDPNLFHLDWDRTAEALATIVILSFLVERALSVLFESSWYIERVQTQGKGTRLKELLAFGVSSLVCILWHFDAVSIIVLAEHTNWFGYLITGGVIAGGSKASIRLFRDVLDFKSTARRDYEEAKKQTEGESVNLTPEELAAIKDLVNKSATKGKKPKPEDG